MTRREKLLNGICANPRDVRFEDACRAAEIIGYRGGSGKGSHRAFQRAGDPIGLNFQMGKDGKIPAYQGRQLAAAIKRFLDDDTRE